MKNVQDIYPASPMQEVMLLHALTRRHNDTLLNQFAFAADAALDAGAFKAAWNAVIARHPILRTAFVTEKVKAPLQVVRQEVAAAFVTEDWRGLDDADRAARYERYCAEDRLAGMNVRRAPLMRLFLARWSESEWRFVWTSHHLLLDRWCLGEVFTDLANAYERIRSGDGAPLPAAPSFRQYIDWLARQEPSQARGYWRERLRGFSAPTPLAGTQDPAAVRTPGAAVRTLAADASQTLKAAARRFAVTPGTLVQAAIALVACDETGRDDVVFGTAAAARPPAIANVERIVGSFVNNLPVRVQLDPRHSLADWLSGLQRHTYERSDYEYLSPLQIAECADLPEHQALFDTLVVWLAPLDEALPLGLRPLSSETGTAYPVTLSVADEQGRVTLHADLHHGGDVAAESLLERVAAQIAALTASEPDTRLASLMPAGSTPPAPAAAGSVFDGAADEVEAATAIDPSLNSGREELSDALTRQLVRREFEAALGVDACRDDDDFFELGGDSLRAARLHAQVCAGTRKKVPLLSLFRSPTVDGMTHTLCDENWPMKPGILLPLRGGGTRPPLFCVASPEVNTLGYFLLARRLDRRRSCHVLQAPPATGKPGPMDPGVIEPMAREYVGALRKAQPSGPYHLLGMCGGAHLALAMARELERAGERIAFFGVVNTWSLYSVSRIYYLHRARRVVNYLAGRLRRLVRDGRQTISAPPRQQRPEAGPPNEDVGLNSPWIRDVGFAWRNPGAAAIDATVHVFRLKRQQYWRIRDRTLGWGRFFGKTAVVPLDGDDHDLLMREPHVQQLAHAVDAVLSMPSDPVVDTPPPLNTVTTGNA